MTNFKKWDGWQKISSRETEEQTPPLSIRQEEKKGGSGAAAGRISQNTNNETVKPFDIKQLDKIDLKQITAKQQEEFSKQISRINEIKIPALCGLCGSLLEKDFFQIRKPELEKICRKCRQTLPRCGQCGVTIGNPIVGLPRQLCSDCKYPSSCLICSANGKYEAMISFSNRKGHYCRKCSTERAKCLFCRLPLTAYKHTADPASYTCRFCRRTSITGSEQAADLYYEVLDFFYRLDTDAPSQVRSIRVTDFDPLIETDEKTNRLGAVWYLAAKDKLTLLKGVPAQNIIDLALNIHSRELTESIAKIKEFPSLYLALITLLKFLYYRENRLYIEEERIRKEGFDIGKSFQLFFRYWEQVSDWKSLKQFAAKTADELLTKKEKRF